jgi:hypothetical protein
MVPGQMMSEITMKVIPGRRAQPMQFVNFSE